MKKTNIIDERNIPYKKTFNEMEPGECFELDNGETVPDACIKMYDSHSGYDYYNYSKNEGGWISGDKVVRLLNIDVIVYYAEKLTESENDNYGKIN